MVSFGESHVIFDAYELNEQALLRLLFSALGAEVSGVAGMSVRACPGCIRICSAVCIGSAACAGCAALISSAALICSVGLISSASLIGIAAGSGLGFFGLFNLRHGFHFPVVTEGDIIFAAGRLERSV